MYTRHSLVSHPFLNRLRDLPPNLDGILAVLTTTDAQNHESTHQLVLVKGCIYWEIVTSGLMHNAANVR